MHDDQLRRLFHSLDRADEPDPAFADALFERLRFTAARPGRSRAPFLLLAAALMIAALGSGVALGSGLIHLPGLSREPLPAPTASATVTPTPAATPSAEPSAVASIDLAADDIVESLVDGLIVRESGRLGSPKIGSLAMGQQAFVIGGPREADGYQWYQLSGLGVPQNSGCTGEEPTDPFGCPVWSGWAAAADLDGTAWLGLSTIECSSTPLGPDDFATNITPIQQLACHGAAPVTVTGYWPVLPEGNGGICPVRDDLQWIACNPDLTHLTASADAGFLEGPIFMIVVPPGVTMPDPGQWLEVTGHFDDPVAAQCDFGDDPSASILGCRTQFVVDRARPTAPPA